MKEFFFGSFFHTFNLNAQEYKTVIFINESIMFQTVCFVFSR